MVHRYSFWHTDLLRHRQSRACIVILAYDQKNMTIHDKRAKGKVLPGIEPGSPGCPTPRCDVDQNRKWWPLHYRTVCGSSIEVIVIDGANGSQSKYIAWIKCRCRSLDCIGLFSSQRKQDENVFISYVEYGSCSSIVICYVIGTYPIIDSETY